MLDECTPSGWCWNVNRLDSACEHGGWGENYFAMNWNFFAKKRGGWEIFRKKRARVIIFPQKRGGGEKNFAKKGGAWEIIRKNVRIYSQRTVNISYFLCVFRFMVFPSYLLYKKFYLFRCAPTSWESSWVSSAYTCCYRRTTYSAVYARWLLCMSKSMCRF